MLKALFWADVVRASYIAFLSNPGSSKQEKISLKVESDIFQVIVLFSGHLKYLNWQKYVMQIHVSVIGYYSAQIFFCHDEYRKYSASVMFTWNNLDKPRLK